MLKFGKVVIIIVFVISMVSSALAAPIQKFGGNQVDWQKETVEAVGFGAPISNAANYAQAKILARRAAIVDAYRNLAEIIEGVQIDSETTMVNAMIANDTIETRVQGLIKNARITKEEVGSDGSYQVQIAVDLYGNNGLSAIAMDVLRPMNEPNIPFLEPSKEFLTSYAAGNYTGVVIDARGFKLQRAFSPAIFNSIGVGLYGVKNIDSDFAISKGMVTYFNSDNGQTPLIIGKDGLARAGNNPLVIKAEALKKNISVVISEEDGNRLLAANKQNHFLDRCAVVFVY